MELETARRLYVAFAVPDKRRGFFTTHHYGEKAQAPLPRALILEPLEGTIEVIPAETYIRKAGYKVAPSLDLPFLKRQRDAALKRLGVAARNVELFEESRSTVQADLDNLNERVEEITGESLGLAAEAQYATDLWDSLTPDCKELMKATYEKVQRAAKTAYDRGMVLLEEMKPSRLELKLRLEGIQASIDKGDRDKVQIALEIAHWTLSIDVEETSRKIIKDMIKELNLKYETRDLRRVVSM